MPRKRRMKNLIVEDYFSSPGTTDLGNQEVASGEAIAVKSGGTIDFESGSNFKIAGTAVGASAAELNLLDGSAVGALVKVKKIPITATPNGDEQDTGWDLPAKSVVLGAWVDVTTAEATGGTKTLDVGLKSGESGGDADGFLDGVSVAATGVKAGAVTITTGANNTYVADLGTCGELLHSVTAGNDVANGGDGFHNPHPHVCNGTAVSVTYTAGSADFAEFRGAIYILYLEFGL